MQAEQVSIARNSRHCLPTVLPEVYREALQILSYQPRYLDDEELHQKAKAAKSYYRLGTFMQLPPVDGGAIFHFLSLRQVRIMSPD